MGGTRSGILRVKEISEFRLQISDLHARRHVVALCLLILICAGLVRCARGAGAPVVGVAGDRLTVNGSPRFVTFLSYFDGVRRARSGNIAADLTYLARHVDGIRVLPNWWASTCPVRGGTDTLIDLDGQIRPAVWRDLQRLLDVAASEGLLVDVSFTRETVTDTSSPARVLGHAAYQNALVELVGSTDFFKGRYPHVLIDVQNEWTRFATAVQIEELLQRVHGADPSRVLAASVSGDAYVPTGRSLATMVAAYHDPRGTDWFTPDAVARQVRAVRNVVAQPVYLQEPMPASSVCEGQLVDRDMAHFRSAVASARESGAAAWTFHTRTTFDLVNQSLVEKLQAPAAVEEKRAIEALR
jgi:hypothetical protein